MDYHNFSFNYFILKLNSECKWEIYFFDCKEFKVIRRKIMTILIGKFYFFYNRTIIKAFQNIYFHKQILKMSFYGILPHISSNISESNSLENKVTLKKVFSDNNSTNVNNYVRRDNSLKSFGVLIIDNSIGRLYEKCMNLLK